MVHRALADLVLVLHLAFIAFAVAGGILALRWRWAPAVQLPAALWAVWVEVRGAVCPLTPLENALRRAAGESGYTGGFVEHYLVPVLYPGALSTPLQLALASAVLLANVLVYSLVWRRRRRAGAARGSRRRGRLGRVDRHEGRCAAEVPAMSAKIVRFDSDAEVREFEKGRFELLRIGGATLGRASYEPGWRWSTHVGSATGASLCEVEHVGMVISGRAAVYFPSGEHYELRPGDVFHVPPGHDSWVVGDEPYVSLHFLGAEQYVR